MKTIIAKRIFGGLLNLGRGTTSIDRKVILIYHSINENEWAVSKHNYNEQMRWLSENATVVSLNSLLKKDNYSNLTVAITFDDGYNSIHEIASPIMGKYGFTATVYLNTGWIQEVGNRMSDASLGHYPSETFMNWSQVNELKKSGWNIGSHGVEHDDLTKLTEEKIQYELKQSKLKIEEKLDTYCSDFSYTWGKYNSKISTLVKESGYRAAVSGDHGPLKENSDKFSLPRVDIRREYNISDFDSVVTGKWDYLQYIQKYRNV